MTLVISIYSSTIGWNEIWDNCLLLNVINFMRPFIALSLSLSLSHTHTHTHTLKCGPCRVFTPKLVTFYKKMKDAGKQFEVIFLSSDRDNESFQGYLSEMPWYALPFDNKLKMKKLSRMFNVVGM